MRSARQILARESDTHGRRTRLVGQGAPYLASEGVGLDNVKFTSRRMLIQWILAVWIPIICT